MASISTSQPLLNYAPPADPPPLALPLRIACLLAGFFGYLALTAFAFLAATSLNCPDILPALPLLLVIATLGTIEGPNPLRAVCAGMVAAVVTLALPYFAAFALLALPC